MKTKHSARSRIRYELCLMCLLLLALVAVLLWRHGQGGAEQAVQPSPTPAAPTEVPGPTAIPDDMFEYREGKYVHVERGEGHSNLIDERRFTDLSVKSATGLVEWAQMAWDNQWGYLWGTFGDILSEELLNNKIQQFGDDVLEYEDIVREKWMGRRVADCAGLIKGYCWYDQESHGIVYCHGDLPDVGTDGFYDLAPEKGTIDTLPEIPGLLVYAEGHIGVYIGDGWAIESISHAGGVVKTRVADRAWTYWLKCPYIQY